MTEQERDAFNRIQGLAHVGSMLGHDHAYHACMAILGLANHMLYLDDKKRTRGREGSDDGPWWT